ncbi:MAG: hypothetical protein E7666_04960 [Ruminococcaceae bacterium]|nr:hypothetical protein [Oscillospiraceae bacterium]
MKQYQISNLLSTDQMHRLVMDGDRFLADQMRATSRNIAKASDQRLIGLTGPTCSGKTTAARLFTDYMESHGHCVHVISVDDFYFDKDYLKKRADDDPNIEIDYDSEDTIDADLLAEKTESLLACKPTRLPRFDFRSGLRVDGVTVTPQAGDIFLFEGIQILYPRVREILSGTAYHSIYISPVSSIEVGGEVFLPNEIRLMRRLVRDFRYRASDPAFTFYLWQSVRENEEKSIFPYADTCHEKIDSTMPYEIGMLKPYLNAILPQVMPQDRSYESAQALLQKIQSVQTIPSSLIADQSLYKEFI